MTIDTNLIWHVFFACLIIFTINLPFGYFRGRFKKMSFMWFLMIHLPVPFVVLIRRFHHLHLTWGLAPFLLGSFFLGQFAGRKIYAKWPYKKKKDKTT